MYETSFKYDAYTGMETWETKTSLGKMKYYTPL